MKNTHIELLRSAIQDAERYQKLKSVCGFGIRRNGVIELSIAFTEIHPDHIGRLDAALDHLIKLEKEGSNRKHNDDPYEGHAENCNAIKSGDRECNCHLAYGFPTAEAMNESEDIL